MTNYDLLLSLLRESGMDFKWAKMFVKKLADDEAAFPADFEAKKWALTKGFFPGRIELYGLNNENYQDFLPDYQYFMIHPINHHFKIWVNDKLTLKYILNSNGCADTMPEYYLYIENNGNYTYLMDSPSNISRNSDYILNLLKNKNALAIKPNSGTSGGRGFVKLVYSDGLIYANNRQITEEDFHLLISSLENNIITEYAYQHHELANIWAGSECTLRIIMTKLPRGEFHNDPSWHCAVSYARFGAKISGGASNLSSGGIGVGFDFETGKLNEFGIRYKKFCVDGIWRLNSHPDTEVIWKGTQLPNWNIAKNKIENVCRHIASLDYLGFDVIITEKGVKFCEINTHPAADYEQVMCGPILKDELSRSFYESKGIRNIDSNILYDCYMKSQI